MAKTAVELATITGKKTRKATEPKQTKPEKKAYKKATKK